MASRGIFSCRVNRVRAQLVHNGVNAIHVSCIGLIARVAFGEVLHEFIHGGLVVAHCGREGVYSLLAGSRIGIGRGDGHERWDSVQDDQLYSQISCLAMRTF